MKQRFLSFSFVAMILTAGALFTSCTQTNTPTTTTTAYTDTYADISGLKMGTQYVFSISGNASNTSLTGVSAWTSSSSDNTGTVRVFWTRGAGDSAKITANATAGSSATSGTMVWAPANLTSMVRLYETSDNNNASGLIVGVTSTTAFISGSQKANIDLVLATIPGAQLPNPVVSIQAADVTGGVGVGGKMTDIATTGHHPGGLAMDIESSNPSSLFPTADQQARFIDLPFRNFKDSSVFFVIKTADATPHYSRIEIVPQPTGSSTAGYLWGDSDPGKSDSKRFVDFNIMYQATAGWGYVDRPGVTRRATIETPRSGAGLIIN